MNREIEFRVWDKTNEQMRYDITGFECSRNAIDGVFIDGDYFNLQNGILMQYTGLKDKNGTKIFEGDIIKIHFTYQTLSGETLGVYEDDKEAKGVVSLTPLGFYIDTKDEYQNYIWEYLSDLSLLEYPEQIEVIGNIYDEVEIKSIVTKEQFEQMEYRIGEDEL